MKERIKKFYRDHEEEVTLALLTVGTASMIIGIKLLKQPSVTVDFLSTSGIEATKDATITVSLTNGKTCTFKSPTN